jgi:hypothetical protein
MHKQFLTASFLLMLISACAPDPAAGVPLVHLGNPVVDARAALAAGDSSYIGLLDPNLTVLGVRTTGVFR